MSSEFLPSIFDEAALLGIQISFSMGSELLHTDLVELIVLRCVVSFNCVDV